MCKVNEHKKCRSRQTEYNLYSVTLSLLNLFLKLVTSERVSETIFPSEESHPQLKKQTNNHALYNAGRYLTEQKCVAAMMCTDTKGNEIAASS